MSDTNETTTSVQEGLTEAADSAEQAVETTTQEAGQQVQAQDAKAILQDPTATKTEKKQAQKMLKKLTLKIDGEEFEENLPFEIPDDPKAIEYMKRELQMGRMGQKRAQEKASIEKEVVRFIQELQAGGSRARKALADPAIGLDIKKLATDIIEEEIENSKKSPEQLEKEKLQAELQALKDENERSKEENKQKEMSRLKEEAYERYDLLMSQALEKSDLPKSPAVVKKMADYMLIGLQNGKDVTPEDILPLVREEIISDYKQLLNSLPDEEVEKFIGKDRINSIRKKSIAKAKQAPAAVKAANKAVDTGKIKTESKEQVKKEDFKKYFGF